MLFLYEIGLSKRDASHWYFFWQLTNLIQSWNQAEDAISLLNTRDGKYAAACALDFMNPPWNHVSGRALSHPAGLYDDFATRDSNGHFLGSHLFPYFKSPKSMAAILAREAIPVQSCWNGLGMMMKFTSRLGVAQHWYLKQWLSKPSPFSLLPNPCDSDQYPTA